MKTKTIVWILPRGPINIKLRQEIRQAIQALEDSKNAPPVEIVGFKPRLNAARG